VSAKGSAGILQMRNRGCGMSGRVCHTYNVAPCVALNMGDLAHRLWLFLSIEISAASLIGVHRIWFCLTSSI